MAILDIRGTHGSGKSWIVHQLLKKFGNKEILDKEKKVIGHYMPKIDAGAVGKYTTVCGGCDTIKTADETNRRVIKFSLKYSHVILEGIQVAHTFERYNQLAQQLGDYYFLFLDTPREVCIQRVEARRKAQGNDKPLSLKHLNLDYKRCWEQLPYKFKAAGRNVVVLKHENPMPQVLELLDA